MAWSDVIGQERAKDILRRSIANKRVAHAYLFHGRAGVGKDALALEFARTLQCMAGGDEACGECKSCRLAAELKHPDVRIIVRLPSARNEQAGDDPFANLGDEVIAAFKDEMAAKARDPYYPISLPKAQVIRINSIRHIRREAARSPVEGRYKIFLILQAEDMNQESSNALLKTLEEPLPNALLLLTSTYPQQLLPTIVSRCQQVECSRLGDDEIALALQRREGCSEDEAVTAARASDGSYGIARTLLQGDVEEERATAVEFLRFAVGQSFVKLSEVVETIVREKDRQGIEAWLKLLQAWIRETYLVQQGSVRQGIIEDDARTRLLQRFPRAALDLSIDCVERAIADTRRNVYLPVILNSLAHELRQHIASPRQA